MKISIWVVFGILHGCCSVHADCPLCMHVAYKVTNVPPGWIQTLREGLSFVEKLNTCARNEMLTPKCTQGYVCSGYYFLYTAKGLKNVNPDIEMSLEMITRGCESPHTNIGCSPLQGTINSSYQGFNMLLNLYEHVSIKEKKCTSEQPTEFNLAIPESKITTESGNTAKNSASYVSTVLEYTFFNGLFLILCLY